MDTSNDNNPIEKNDDKSKENDNNNIENNNNDTQEQTEESKNIQNENDENLEANEKEEKGESDNNIKNEEEEKSDNEEKKSKNENEEEEEKVDDNKEEDEKEEEKPKERSVYSLEGAKTPLSLYTRRVMDISKIGDYLSDDSTKGQCGGHNLGNTCFMNSSIACLSNCTELTYYFLKGDYKKDINTENDLGMHGELAESWGNLLHEYWVENTSVGDPRDFKYTIGKKAVRFRGYNQHDSNEFMSIFLDYLNEDLNRTTKKQYIELNEKQDNETDIECAKRFWECNLKRNDSIITDLFCGQFKSTITCPKCNKINITFDPFDTINLPMMKKKRYGKKILEDFKFFYVPKYCLRDMFCLKIENVDEDEYFEKVIDRIKKEKKFVYNDKIDKLLLVDVYNKKKYEYIEKMKQLSGYTCRGENVFSFDIMDKNEDLQIPIYFLKDDDIDSKSEYPRIVFGKNDMTIDDLRKKIYFNLRKYILSPLLKENEEKDAMTLEIEKYCNDEKLELEDEKLFEMIDKEYQEVFNSKQEIDEEDEKEKEGENNDEEKEKEENKEEEKEENKEEEKEENKEEDKEKNEEKEENKEKKKETEEDDKKEKEKKGESKEDEIIDEKEKCIQKFRKDIPFKIYLKKNSHSDNIILVDGNYFRKLSPELKEISNLRKFSDSLEDIFEKLENYKLYVEFNENSKYINKDKYDLDFCKIISFEYEIKQEEKKAENEEEDDGRLTLEKCLRKFTKEEQLEEGNEWYCSNCKEHVLAKKKMELFYVPKILIICFKRFIKESIRWEKNEDNVEFPIDNLDLKDIVIGPDREHSKYDLFAVSQHYGSTGFGHYTAVCKNDGKWFSYDDSSCSLTNASSCQSSAAYVLFYRRQTD